MERDTPTRLVYLGTFMKLLHRGEKPINTAVSEIFQCKHTDRQKSI